MFPPFRVRGVRIADGEGSSAGPRLEDGYIRISSQDYDDLMKRKPKAALKYIDSDDGEMILVGSAFELGQRLHDPIDPSELQRHFEVSSNKRLSPPPMHVFDVERETDVLEEWQKLDRQTQWAAVLHGLKTPQEEQELKKTSLEKMNTTGMGFGRPSPLSINSWARKVERSQADNAHTKRWASYSRVLPGRLDQKASELPASEPVPKPATATSNPTPQSNELPNNMETKKTGKEPTAPKSENQQKSKTDGPQAHEPLLAMFEKELAKILPSTRNLSDSITPCIEKATTVIDDIIPESAPQPNEPGLSSGGARATPIEKDVKPSHPGLDDLCKVLQDAGVDIEAGARDAEEALKKILEARSSILSSVQSVFPYLKLSNSDTQKAGPPPTTSNAATQVSTRSDPSNSTETPKPTVGGQKTPRWEVERIIGRRYICYGSYKNGPKIRQYLVRWVGHTEESDVWYDAENLADCESLVHKYEVENPEESLVDLDGSFIPSLHEALKLHDRTARSVMVTWAERNSSGGPTAARNISRATSDRKFDPSQTKSEAAKASAENNDTAAGSTKPMGLSLSHLSEPAAGAGSSVSEMLGSPSLNSDSHTSASILRGRRRSLPMLYRNPEGAKPEDLEAARNQHAGHEDRAQLDKLQKIRAQQGHHSAQSAPEPHTYVQGGRSPPRTAVASVTPETYQQQRETGLPQKYPRRSLTVKDDRPSHLPKDSKENRQKLKHRQSWHPVSNTAEKDTKEANAFNFDPFAVMWKYPTVPQFERSHFVANPPSLPKQTPNVMDAPTVQRAEIPEAPAGSASLANAGLPENQAPSATQNSSKPDEIARLFSSLEPQPAATLDRRQSVPRKMPSTPILKPTLHPQRSATVHGRPQHPPARVSFSDVTSVIQPRENSYAGFPHPPPKDEDAVKKCHKTLLDMGFKVSQALEIARAANGDLETAIDIADEDQKARSSSSVGGSSRMPGAWNGNYF